jgi:hypothetical protein
VTLMKTRRINDVQQFTEKVETERNGAEAHYAAVALRCQREFQSGLSDVTSG